MTDGHARESGPALRDVSTTPRPQLWRGVIRSTGGRAGLGIGVLMLGLIGLGRFFAPYSPSQIGVGPPTAGPSAAHILGTDNLGRDVLSRFLYGGSTVLLIPLCAVAIGILVGGTLGMVGAYRGGAIDRVICRVFDVLIVLPALLVVLVLIAGLGTSNLVIIVIVATVFAPRLGKLIRGATQPVAGKDFVVAAQLRGESIVWIVRRELLPNVVGAVLAAAALYLTYGIIFVSTLSFLGLGAQPPSSDWGLMVAEAQSFITFNLWATLAPAAGIALISVSCTLLADAVNAKISRNNVRAGG